MTVSGRSKLTIEFHLGYLDCCGNWLVSAGIKTSLRFTAFVYLIFASSLSTNSVRQSISPSCIPVSEYRLILARPVQFCHNSTGLLLLQSCEQKAATSGAAFPYEKIAGVRIICGAFQKYWYYFVDSKIAESFELDSDWSLHLFVFTYFCDFWDTLAAIQEFFSVSYLRIVFTPPPAPKPPQKKREDFRCVVLWSMSVLPLHVCNAKRLEKNHTMYVVWLWNHAWCFPICQDFWTDVTRLFAVSCSIGSPKYSSIFPFAHSFLSSWFFCHHCFHRVVAWTLLSSARHKARSLKFYTSRRSRTSDVESLSLFQKTCTAN